MLIALIIIAVLLFLFLKGRGFGKTAADITTAGVKVAAATPVIVARTTIHARESVLAASRGVDKAAGATVKASKTAGRVTASTVKTTRRTVAHSLHEAREAYKAEKTRLNETEDTPRDTRVKASKSA